jgi:hypothetical protein
VLTLKFPGHTWVTVGLAVAGEEPDGVGVGLDGPGALVFGLQGPPETPVQDQEMTAGQLAVPSRRLRIRHRSPHKGVVERLAMGSVLRFAE